MAFIRSGRGPATCTSLLLFITALGAIGALSIDPVRAGFGIRGDEATYVSMALSVAHDGDLAYDAGDLERFWRIYQSGPEGIFLKRGTTLEWQLSDTLPYISTRHAVEARADRLFFGKAYAYGAAAAPWARLAGLNGLLAFNVVMFGACVLSAYAFARRMMPDGVAAAFATVFFGLSITPVYIVWLTPEVFHVTLVTVAYLLFFAKAVPTSADRRLAWLEHPATDVVAAILLGVATFSKPPNVLLIVPPLAVSVARWQWLRTFGVAAVFAATTAGLFGVNALVSGEFNYQGGERKTFYGRFPFERADASFAAVGIPMTTSELGADEIQETSALARDLRHNLVYFAIGRHFGFVPYYFPAVVVLALWCSRWRRWRLWHVATVGVVGASALTLLIVLPNSWSGGGGPPGNRYFLSLYPALAFLVPPMARAWPVAIAGAGGAIFIAHLLINPFVAAKLPWANATSAVLRRLPIELTMVNDLPVMLNQGRARVPYGRDPVLFLYFLDDNAWLPEPAGIWIRGDSHADLIVRTDRPLRHLAFRVHPVRTGRIWISAGLGPRQIAVQADRDVTIVLPTAGVETHGAFAYPVSVDVEGGAVPALTSPSSTDGRYLGVLIGIEPRLSTQVGPPEGS